MKAYSIDLRQKIMETYEQESISQRKLAERFRVAPSFIYKLLKQYKEKGTLEPKGHGGGQGLKLRSEEVIILTELVADKNDATLAELKEKLYEQTQTQVSISTISRLLLSLGLTRKKNVPRHRKTNRTSAKFTERVYATSDEPGSRKFSICG